jgi:hypothetical protein
MNENRSSRWLIWTGPLFALLFLVAAVVLESDGPGEKASGAEVMKYFNAHQGRGMISVFATPLVVALLLLFASSVRTRARRHGESEVGATVMLAGAVLWAAGMLVGSLLDLALLSASDNNQSDVAQGANVLASADWIPFIGGIAIFLIGAGLTVLASRVMPAWLGWIALVVGVVSLAGPGGFIGFFVAPLWILVAGIMLAVRRDDTAPATSDVTAQPSPAVS